MRSAIVFLLLLCSISCNKKSGNSSGYGDVTELYKASMVAMQSMDMEKIKEFVRKVLPDQGTINAMKRSGDSYRGIPEALVKEPTILTEWKKDLAQRLYDHAQQLEFRGLLKDLRFIGFDEGYEPEPLGEEDGAKDILFTEPFGIFATPKDTIEYKIGELLKIDGKWKSFTEAKL